MPRIDIALHVDAPREVCFDLARSIDAHLQSTAATGERVVAGKMSGLLELGDEVTWRARHLGVWQELSSRITAYDRPSHFRDTMQRGAFSWFEHDHFFTVEGDGTLCRDVFEYEAPLGPLGRIAERLFLTTYMRRFLHARLMVLKELAESHR